MSTATIRASYTSNSIAQNILDFRNPSQSIINPTTPSLIDQIKNIVYNTKDVKPTQNVPDLTADQHSQEDFQETEYLNLITNNFTRNSQIDLSVPIFRPQNPFHYSSKPTIRPSWPLITTTNTNQMTINLLDWLASKSKLRTQKKSGKNPKPETTTQMQTIVKSVNGDIFQYIEDTLDDIHGASETVESESTLQVTMPNITENHEDLISNDIIYYDHELTGAETEDMLAEPSEVKFIVYPSKNTDTDTFLDFVNDNTAGKDVFPHEDNLEVITALPIDVTDEQIDDVMNHNTKLVGILKNTLEMQAFLFDKLFSYMF